MKVVVAHPGKQHSYRSAVALQNSGMLLKYLSTTYQKRGSITKLITDFLPEKAKKKAQSHHEKDLNDESVGIFCEGMSLLSLLLKRLGVNKRIIRSIEMWKIDRFGVKVAKYAVRNNADAVVMWDTTSVACFEYLDKHAPNIIRILDCSTANRLFLKSIYEEDMKRNAHNYFYKNVPFLWEDESQRMYAREIEMADYFIGASEFVEKSYLYSQVEEDRIRKVPYGVDIDKYHYQERMPVQQPLKLLFVGGVNEQKGIHYLLKAIGMFSDGDVELDLVGAYDKNSCIFETASQMNNVTLSGFVTQDVIFEKYANADVYVFATLGEGMTMSGLEAMSTGLPMICSDNAGYNDVIVNGVNGYIFKTGDVMDLADKIKLVMKNKDSLKAMSKNARKTAESYTWNIYYENYAKTVSDLIGKGSPWRVR